MYFQWLKLEYNNIDNGWTFQVSIFLFEYSILLTFYFIIYIEKEFWCYFYKFKYNYWGTLYLISKMLSLEYYILCINYMDF